MPAAASAATEAAEACVAFGRLADAAADWVDCLARAGLIALILFCLACAARIVESYSVVWRSD